MSDIHSISKRRAFWAEKRTHTKSLRQQTAWYLRNSKVASVAGAERGQGRMAGSEVRGNEGAACVGLGGHCKEKNGELL